MTIHVAPTLKRKRTNERKAIKVKSKKTKQDFKVERLQEPKMGISLPSVTDRGGNTKKKRKRKQRSNGNEDESRRNHNSSSVIVVTDNENGGNTKRLLQNSVNNSGSKSLQSGNQKLSLIDKMRARLQGGHFRKLNEMLYTCKGNEAQELFAKSPHAFAQYHEGYREQISHWPENPIDTIIKWIKKRNNDLLVIADFGCGEGKLASSVKNKVFSLDLISTKPEVIACNMANTPLNDDAVDVCVFCLSLMGIDYYQYLFESCRVLKFGGWLLIAEIKSRFDENNGGASTKKFVKALKSIGFSLKTQDESNKMFIMWVFRKESKVSLSKFSNAKMEWPNLKPCLYKRR